ncbi:hypothetical protein AS038_05525 [Arthrobacter sp. NIO-1057]|nr:hypothetical protein AS038_05525 [Arthrobacter sp. NIO-1057]SCC01102.1 hypothetical protein GA0061084_1119 [Arthrobacter sp. NIO-1057]
MAEVFSGIAPIIALIGGIVLFVALFTPKRFTAKRPARFVLGWGLLMLSGGMWFYGSQFAV